MKRALILPAVLTIVSMSHAATLPFDTEVPHFSMIRSKGVNVRQLPSATAKKIVYMEEDADFGATPLDVAKWSATTPRGYTSYQFYGPSTFLSEKNGWYEIEGLAPQYKGSGWVSAKYCEPFKPAPIVYPNTYHFGSQWKWIKGGGDIPEGQYAITYEYVGGSDVVGVVFYVGKLVDGYLVCPYALGTQENPIFWNVPDDNLKECTITPPTENSFGMWQFTPCNNTGDWLEPFEFSKITDSFANEIVGRAIPLEKTVVFYNYNGYLYTVN